MGMAALASVVLIGIAAGLLSGATDGPTVLGPKWATMFGWVASLTGTGLVSIWLVASGAGARGL